MINKMKMMISPKNFMPHMKRPGQSINYLNCNQVKNIMSEQRVSQTRFQANSTLSGVKPLKPGSYFNKSSIQNQNLSTTIDGTQFSIQQQYLEGKTDVDPLEQAHNTMNLSLGKPTQNFNPHASINKPKENLYNIYGPKPLKI